MCMLTTMFLSFDKIADAKPEQVLMEECTELRTEINKKDVAIAKHHEKYVLVYSVGSIAGFEAGNIRCCIFFVHMWTTPSFSL